VSSIWEAARNRFASAAVVRQAREALLRARGRRLVTRFDQTDPARAQLRVLLGLLHQARKTRFGVAHDFGRVRTADDFRRLVPLATRAELWHDCWEPALPRVAGATWPALPSAALRGANNAALRTALALAAQARPPLRLLDGRVAWLGDDIALSPDAAHPTPRANDAFGSACLPWELRPYSTPHLDPAAPLTCVAGSWERLLKLFENAKQASGHERAAEVWPQLRVVFYSRRATDPDASALRAELGDGVLLLEIGALREGMVSVEDPRYGLPRLLPDHGVYFEFVPAAEADSPAPTRLGVGEVECGVPYQMVLTSAAGVWACRAGVTVQFERREPLLFRFVEVSAGAARPAAPESQGPGRLAGSTQAPHRRSADIPAAPPESFAHTPWLTPADRG
jgi:hypothetical protein